MEVISFEVFEDELILGFEGGLIVIARVEKGMVSPPCHLGQRTASEAYTSQPHSVSDVKRAQLQSNFVQVAHRVNFGFFGRHCNMIILILN